MTILNTRAWEVTAGLVVVASATAGVLWWLRRHRPTPEEIERARREYLVSSGRLVDGMLLDVRELEFEGRKLTFLEYSYRIGGADYECSQDVSSITDVVHPDDLRAGLPCTVRYVPNSPQNSIVVAENWSGLRDSLPDVSMLGKAAPGRTAH